MSNIPAKVFIKVESNAEQQENMKNSRKTLKVLQRGATDKENLVGRPILKGKGGFTKSKSEFDIKTENAELLKRKKTDTKTAQTQTEANILEKVAITAEDLTTTRNPGEKYWEILAEKRRIALDTTLIENKNLHDRIEGLESELNTSKQMLDEAKGLVELLTEMLEEKESNEPDSSKDITNLITDDSNINQGASTSGETSKYFDADSSESPNKISSLSNNDSDDDD